MKNCAPGCKAQNAKNTAKLIVLEPAKTPEPSHGANPAKSKAGTTAKTTYSHAIGFLPIADSTSRPNQKNINISIANQIPSCRMSCTKG